MPKPRNLREERGSFSGVRFGRHPWSKLGDRLSNKKPVPLDVYMSGMKFPTQLYYGQYKDPPVFQMDSIRDPGFRTRELTALHVQR